MLPSGWISTVLILSVGKYNDLNYFYTEFVDGKDCLTLKCLDYKTNRSTSYARVEF